MAKDVGGLQALQEIAGADQPPPAWHVLVRGDPKNPSAQTHVYCEAPAANVGVTEPAVAPVFGLQGLQETPGGKKL